MRDKIRVGLFLLIGIAFSVTVNAQTPVETYGALSVNGSAIVDKNDAAVSLAGPSLFWSNTGWGGEKYYTADVVSWVRSDWNATIIRASMGVDDNGGLFSDPNNKQKVTTVVDAAIAEGMYVIIDWHSHHAEDYEQEAIDFFSEMSEMYGETDNVIYEIYNEPLQVSWSNVIKPYAEAVIAAIRENDPDNLIIVGTPTWSQDVDVASNDPIIGYDNIAYTLHFYAGTHQQYLRDKATTAMNNGIALMITEWGTVDANGDGSVATTNLDQWVTFMKENKITNCNWALNDKAEGASVLNPGASTGGNWTASDLTNSGTVVKNLLLNWEDSEPDPNPDPEVTLSLDSDQIVEISVYPNPTSQFLNVKFTHGSGIAQIRDLSGKTHVEIAVNNKGSINLDISDLKNGQYFFQFNGEGASVLKKFIIQ